MSDEVVSARERFAFEASTRDRELAIKERECAVAEQELALKQAEAKASHLKSPLFLAVVGATLAAVGNIAAMLFSGSQQRDLEDRKFGEQKQIEQGKSEASRVLTAINTGGDPDKAASNLKFLIETQLIEDPNLRGKIGDYLKNRPVGSGAATSSGVAETGSSMSGAGLLTCRLQAQTDFKVLEDAVGKALKDPPFNAISNWYTSADGDHGLSSAYERQAGAEEKLQLSFHLFKKSNDVILQAILTARSETLMSLMPTGDAGGRIISRDVWYQYMGPLQKTLEAATSKQGGAATCRPSAAL